MNLIQIVSIKGKYYFIGLPPGCQENIEEFFSLLVIILIAIIHYFLEQLTNVWAYKFVYEYSFNKK